MNKRSWLAKLALFSFQCSFIFAQSDTTCHSIISTNNDRMTGEVSIDQIEPSIAKDSVNGYTIAMKFRYLYSQKDIFMVLRIIGSNISCIEEYSDVYFLFEDGSRSTMTNRNKFNCQGQALLRFDDIFDGRRHVDILSKKNVIAIRVNGMNSYYECDFTKAESIRFKQSLRCIKNNIH